MSKNFSNATQVKFGELPTSSFTIISDTIILAAAGNGRNGKISVTTPAGTAYSRHDFSFAGPLPEIISFTPSGTLGDTITITGNHFVANATEVNFGNYAGRDPIVNSSTSIKVVLGEGNSGDVAVTTPYGRTIKPGFFYIPRAPFIDGVRPGIATEGLTVTISGHSLLQLLEPALLVM